jgi:hypothetical protein
MTRWSAAVLFGAGTVAYLAAMTTGPMFLAWGVIFGVTLLCLREIKQGRVSFGARHPDCSISQPARESHRGALA